MQPLHNKQAFPKWLRLPTTTNQIIDKIPYVHYMQPLHNKQDSDWLRLPTTTNQTIGI